MDSNFDLNIDNYTIKELESIFELTSNYDESLINSQENKIRINILNDNTTPTNTKNKTLSFIKTISQKLINNVNKNTFNISNNNISNNNFSSNNNLNQNLKNTLSNISSLSPNMPLPTLDIYTQHLDHNLYQSDITNNGSAPIIKKPITPYGNGYAMEFYPGTLNPLNKRILKKLVNIDTRFRENYYTTTSTNFQIDLPGVISQVVFLELGAIEIPFSFYSISKVFGNNFFTLEIENEEPLVINIPDGNYDVVSLIGYINNYLSNLPIIIPGYDKYNKITVTADLSIETSSIGGSERMIFGSIDGLTKFSINFLTDRFGMEDRQTPLPLKLGWLMGYREGYYENSFTYVSEGLVNLLGPRYFYLVVDDYNNNVSDGFYGAFNSSLLNKNILARISVLGASLTSTNVNFSSFTGNLVIAPRHYFGPVNISKLKIQLLDEYGRILNMNNMDFSFVLAFLVVYDL
uniref:Uncharacterized protein n=1 Tax=viral metagenome TaxID=1070528 RepID=A0A6C0KMK9_9ZZZZ